MVTIPGDTQRFELLFNQHDGEVYSSALQDFALATSVPKAEFGTVDDLLNYYGRNDAALARSLKFGDIIHSVDFREWPDSIEVSTMVIARFGATTGLEAQVAAEFRLGPEWPEVVLLKLRNPFHTSFTMTTKRR